MASEDLISPLLNSSSSNTSSPSTTIVMLPDPTPTFSIVPSLKTINESTNEHDFGSMLTEKRRSTRTILMSNVSRRLIKRKELHNRLSSVSNVMCVLGLLGVLLMIIENEITFINIYEKETIYSWFIKLIITITTIILVGFVFYYHYIDLQLYSINNSLDNWRIGLIHTKILLILFETIICLIHPIPRSFPRSWNLKFENPVTSNSIPLSYIAIDVALGLPMFARIYLLCRFIMFHSHLVRDASTQSLGYLNQVSINFFFLIKTYLEQWPTRCLLTICSFLFLIGSWSLRACNYKSDFTHLSMLDSMWLFIVTFTTVGYGDLTPSTYCGRSVAAITGLIGVLSTALLISVLAQKLLLTRSEKYVHNFALKIGLAKECKNQSANVVKYALKLWFLKRKHTFTSMQYITAQRKLFRSILVNQLLKQEQRHLVDNCIGLPELHNAQRETNDRGQENTERLTLMQLKVEKIEEKLIDINKTMFDIHETLNVLLNKMK